MGKRKKKRFSQSMRIMRTVRTMLVMRIMRLTCTRVLFRFLFLSRILLPGLSRIPLKIYLRIRQNQKPNHPLISAL